MSIRSGHSVSEIVIGMPQISIVIPVYNAEQYLRDSLESILSQSFHDWELILVDDGSTDGSLQIIREFEIHDNRIISFSQDNGGPSKARNRGIDEAKGEYVYFMDADDWLEPTFLESFFCSTGNVNNDIVFQGFQREYPDGRSEKMFAMDSDTTTTSKEDIICKLYKEHVYGWAWCKLFRREIINKYHLRYDESLNLWEDELFTTEYLKHAKTVRTVNNHLYHYRILQGSLMQTNNTYLKRLFLSERMKEALRPVANTELKEYLETTYNRNLKYSLIMALKNEQNHKCDDMTKNALLDRYYARCKEYPAIRKYNVLKSKLSFLIVESILQTRCKRMIISVFSIIRSSRLIYN